MLHSIIDDDKWFRQWKKNPNNTVCLFRVYDLCYHTMDIVIIDKFLFEYWHVTWEVGNQNCPLHVHFKKSFSMKYDISWHYPILIQIKEFRDIMTV